MGGADTVFPFKKFPLNVEVVAKYWTTGSTSYSVEQEGLYIAFEGYDPGSNIFSINNTTTAEIIFNEYVFINDASVCNIAVFYGKVDDVISITWGKTSGVYGQSITKISF